MNTAFVLYDLRRSLSVLAFVWATVTGFLIYLSGPLQGSSPNSFQLLGLFSGMLLAARLMSDTGKTQAYVHSRGLTRRRIVLLRIALGLALIMLLGLWIWLAILLGLRDRLHAFLHMQDAIFYPMSSRFERSIAIPYLLSGMGAFGVMSFYMTWRGLCCPSWNGTTSGMARLALLEVPAGVFMLFMGVSSISVVLIVGDSDDYQTFAGVLMWLPTCLSVVALIASWATARNLEVG